LYFAKRDARPLAPLPLRPGFQSAALAAAFDHRLGARILEMREAERNRIGPRFRRQLVHERFDRRTRCIGAERGAAPTPAAASP